MLHQTRSSRASDRGFHAAIVEIVLRKLEQDADAVIPAGADVLVLLTSTQPRLRTLGLRLQVGLRP